MKTGQYIFIVQVTRQLSIDIINQFAEKGNKITLVTGIVESNYASLHPSVKTTLFNKHTSVSTIRRLISWFSFTFFAFFYVLFKSKKNELVLISTPPFIVFLGSFFNWLRKQKFHVIIWDLYPDVLINMNVLRKNSPIIRLWEKANVSCFKRSENIFTLGTHLSDALKKYTSANPVIIPNWTNTNFIKPIDKSENLFIKQHQLENKFIVMYSGNLGITHNIEAIIDTAEVLLSNNSIQFIIIGEGAKKEKISKLVHEKKLNNVLMLPYQDKEMLPYSLTSADIGIVTLGDGAENVSVPSKTYYLLAAGVSILAFASEQSELGLLLKLHECGTLFENPTGEIVSKHITEVMFDHERLISNKNKSRLASYQYGPDNAKIYYNYIRKTSSL